MTGTTPTPWHRVVKLRDDLRSGELSLAVFAADLYEVTVGTARRVYRDPGEFFSLTYPTYNLRELAKEVVLRLAGRSERAVRQLELTYGGGKTHALITLYHLVKDPSRLPDLPAVREFTEHAGQTPPQARVAVLAFDKLDVEKGMEIVSPQGERRWLRHPWSVLAFQIAGSEGLRLLHAEERDEERESAPAENLLRQLLAMPAREDLGTLVLIDEVLMFAREKVGRDGAWLSRLTNFFQYLTQAATAVDRCAVVASLLATDPSKSDTLGKRIATELSAIFRREKEEGIQPVLKRDVAEILRRRFFTPDSIRDRETFRPHVSAALQGIRNLDELTARQGPEAEERYLASYPFHPDLTEVLYTKWTNLESFQRTRGVLRTFALALRDAEAWDESPLVGLNVLLSRPGETELSRAARELANMASTEEYDGKRQEWAGILEGELAKARQIQEDLPALRHREIEQAVLATFLHSQPVGQKAVTRELLALLGHTNPDRIELEKGLRRWAADSWFLDEACLSDVETGPDGQKLLPKSWRLGARPNLTQMHHAACARLPAELVEARLVEEIGKTKSLTAGAAAAGARVHKLPKHPDDIPDDAEFHYAVLGPRAASEPGRPSPEAVRFIEQKTGPQKPRTYRNAVVLAVPSPEGLEVARTRVRRYLGWEEVEAELERQKVTDPVHLAALKARRDEDREAIPGAIQQAYCIVVTSSSDNRPEAFRVKVDSEPLFNIIKADPRSRIQDAPVAAEALLPGGPYDLWQEGETSRRVKDLATAFAWNPHLPKVLDQKAVLETLLTGCENGLFVMRYTRPDRSVRTFWMERPDDVAVKDPSLELVLPQAATLTELRPGLLAPGALPDLWPPAPAGDEGAEGAQREAPGAAQVIRVRDIYDYFAGGRTVTVPRGDYDDTLTIPRAEREVIDAAVHAAVRAGTVWLTGPGGASVLEEEVPPGVLTEESLLRPPPPAMPPTAVLPEELPEAWPQEGGPTTALAILSAVSARAGLTLPWTTVRRAIDGALKTRLLQLAEGSAPWPCELAGAKDVRLEAGHGDGPPPGPRAWPRVAEAELDVLRIQNLAEVIGELTSTAGHLLTYRLRVELAETDEDTARRVEELLKRACEDLVLRPPG